MTTMDRFTETASRWMARRTTRRSFLGNVGKAAVLTAGGSAITAVFAQRAEARLCGQTGVSPKCPTYDCLQPAFWGYCWYASPGCCANGGLKKICDCCLTGWPNVQGYCPDGASVYCVVESCLEDPRVQTVTFQRWAGDNPVTASVARSSTLPAGSTANVVIGSGALPIMGALAIPVAGALGAPLLLTPTDRIPDELVTEMTRLGVKRIIVAAPGLSDGARAALDRVGAVEVIASAKSDDLAGASVGIAAWLHHRNALGEIVVIGDDGDSSMLAAAAGAYATARRGALLVGPDAGRTARDLARSANVVAVGAGLKGQISDSEAVVGVDVEETSLKLADRVIGSDSGSLSLGVASYGAGGFAPIVGRSNVLIVHVDNTVSDRVRDWVNERRRRFNRAEMALGAPGALDNGNIYRMQSALNGFDAHQLAGYAGEGFPVYPQPLEEREIGRARVSGELPSTSRPPGTVRKARAEDRFPVRTVAMPPPTSWPPGSTTTPLPPESEATTRPPKTTPSTKPKS